MGGGRCGGRPSWRIPFHSLAASRNGPPPLRVMSPPRWLSIGGGMACSANAAYPHRAQFPGSSPARHSNRIWRSRARRPSCASWTHDRPLRDPEDPDLGFIPKWRDPAPHEHGPTPFQMFGLDHEDPHVLTSEKDPGGGSDRPGRRDVLLPCRIILRESECSSASTRDRKSVV